jgi:hypothetical protein
MQTPELVLQILEKGNEHCILGAKLPVHIFEPWMLKDMPPEEERRSMQAQKNVTSNGKARNAKKSWATSKTPSHDEVAVLLRPLAQSLAEMPVLQRLHLEGCGLQDHGLSILLPHLAGGLPHLSCLSLARNGLKSFRLIAHLIEGRRRLQLRRKAVPMAVLDLSANPSLGASSSDQPFTRVWSRLGCPLRQARGKDGRTKTSRQRHQHQSRTSLLRMICEAMRQGFLIRTLRLRCMRLEDQDLYPLLELLLHEVEARSHGEVDFPLLLVEVSLDGNPLPPKLRMSVAHSLRQLDCWQQELHTGFSLRPQDGGPGLGFPTSKADYATRPKAFHEGDVSKTEGSNANAAHSDGTEYEAKVYRPSTYTIPPQDGFEFDRQLREGYPGATHPLLELWRSSSSRSLPSERLLQDPLEQDEVDSQGFEGIRRAVSEGDADSDQERREDFDAFDDRTGTLSRLRDTRKEDDDAAESEGSFRKKKQQEKQHTIEQLRADLRAVDLASISASLAPIDRLRRSVDGTTQVVHDFPDQQTLDSHIQGGGMSIPVMQVPDRSVELGFSPPPNIRVYPSDSEQEGSGTNSPQSTRRPSREQPYDPHERLDNLRQQHFHREAHPRDVEHVLRHALQAVRSEESFNAQGVEYIYDDVDRPGEGTDDESLPGMAGEVAVFSEVRSTGLRLRGSQSA